MIAENLAVIKKRIALAAENAGRAPNDITLIAVSKRKPVSMISEALAAGQKDFGENYLQEAQEKITALPSAAIRWHFIGKLQSNKARHVVRDFQLIHTVDRPKLARIINKEAKKLDKQQEILVQVNVGRELQKGGVLPEGLEELLRVLQGMSNITVRGLMTMPPATTEPQQARPSFASLRQLGEKYQQQGLITPAKPLILSMGMSNDFEAAISEGATMVRVGTAIFGRREG